nr:MAG TPA: Ftsk gamma domain [Caudoviricetes sp.]
MGRKKSIIPGFSLNRALGISSAKQKIARATGIPTTKQGRKRKMQNCLWTAVAAGVAAAVGPKPQTAKPVQPTKIPTMKPQKRTPVVQPREIVAIPEEDLYAAAVSAVIDEGAATVAFLQSKLKIGYARAARLMDELEDNGIVGPFAGSKPRIVLVTREQLDARGE